MNVERDANTNGLTLAAGLRALSEDVSPRPLRRALAAIADRLASGKTWEQSIVGHSQKLPQPLQELFAVGLDSGQLAHVLESYLRHTRRGSELRRTIRGNAVYSAVLLLALFSVTLLFVFFVVPGISESYADFGVQLPTMTMVFLQFSGLLLVHGLFFVSGLAVFVVVSGLVGFWAGKPWRRRLYCSLPLIGPAARNSSLSTFCHLLAVMTEQGVPLKNAVQAAGTASRDADLEQCCRGIADDLETGASLESSATPRLQFPGSLLHVFRWSDRAASFPAALHAAGDSLDGQASIRAGLVKLVVEPIVIFSVAVTVILMFIALFSPLFQLIVFLA